MSVEPFEVPSPASDALTLADLDRLNGLSVRAFNVCGKSDLRTLGDIRRFKRVKRDFLELFGCGKKTAIELEDLLEKVGYEAHGQEARTDVGQPPPDPEALDETVLLAEIAAKYPMLSVRARNAIAEYLGDDSPVAILTGVIRSDFAFRQLRNVRIKTIREIEMFRIAVCSVTRIEPLRLGGHGSHEPPAPGSQPQAAFGPAEREVTASLAAITDQWAMLSVRARNVLEQFAESAEPEDLYRALLARDFRLPKLRNSGAKTEAELEQFVLAIMPYEGTTQTAGTTAPSAVSHLGNVLRAHFTAAELRYIKPAEFGDAHDQVDVFALLDRVADLHRANPAVPWRVFETFAVQPGYQGTTAELAARLEVTRERVRQIELQLPKFLRSHFGFLGKLVLPEVLRPLVEQRKPVVIIPLVLVEEVNRICSARWSAWFIAQVSALMSRGQLKHVGWKHMGLNGRRSRELDHRAPLLVASHLIEDLTHVSRSLVELLDRPRSEDEAVVLGELVPDGREELLDEMEIALRVLLPFLSERIAFEPGTCILPANRKRRMEDLLEEVLVEYDQPTHASTLVDRLRIMDPDRDWTIESVRALVVRFKDRFISFGRTSTYGLRKWEQQKVNVKGGTIRDIAYQLLRAEDMPIHVEDLTARIQRFRPTTNAASVRLNLQLDQDGRFILFPNAFIGLSGRKYEQEPEPIKRVPSTFFRVSVLRRFVGSSLTDVVSFLEQRSDVAASRIRALLDKKVLDGTIVLGDGEMITAIAQEKRPDASEPSGTSAVGELPFDWGDE